MAWHVEDGWVLARRPRTPCALRLGEPYLPVTASDAPRRTPVRRAGSPVSRDRGARSRLSSGQGTCPGAPGLELARVGLERVRPRPRAPSIGSIPGLATRAGEFEASTIRRCSPSSHPFACCDVAPVRPGLSYRLTLPRARFGVPRGPSPQRSEKMRLTDFCNCTSRHEHLLERSDSRGDGRRSHAFHHVRWSQSSTERPEWPRC
jgi:hypothetical protein